jgi:TetR/AcrR family transcriptional regulator, tetracycline repressor protein
MQQDPCLKLTLEAILNAAQALIDDEGLDGLNMRELARRLDAQASALYWHIGNRSELLTRLADRYYGRAFEVVPEGLDWPDWLRSYGQAFHSELLSHRDAAQVCGFARPRARDVRLGLDRLAAPLLAVGLTREQALACQSSIIALAMGWAMYEQSPHMKVHLKRAMDLQLSFMQGLDAMVTGLASTLVVARRKARPRR